MKARVVAVVAAGIFGTVGFATPAQAAKPAEQACLGEFFSFSAQTSGVGFGQAVAFFAHKPDVNGNINLGEAIQNLQAGTAPLFPLVCN